MILFHWQHVYDGGYVAGNHLVEWKFKDAAVVGSSVLPVPWCLRWFFCAPTGFQPAPLAHLQIQPS